jgi:predicted transcriptional regulator
LKSVLISIQPKWIEKICHEIGKENGKPIYEKVIEVRKTRPKIETPFKCYIYETKGFYKGSGGCLFNGRGKVIGEFVCNKIQSNFKYLVTPKGLESACLTEQEVRDYLRLKGGYGWHISNLKIYDKPKELSEFRKPCKFAYSSYEEGICYEDCIQGKLEDCRNFCLPITRPPQSWCYVESLGE